MYKCYEDVTYVNSGVIVLFSSCFIYYDHFFFISEMFETKNYIKIVQMVFFFSSLQRLFWVLDININSFCGYDVCRFRATVEGQI